MPIGDKTPFQITRHGTQIIPSFTLVRHDETMYSPISMIPSNCYDIYLYMIDCGTHATAIIFWFGAL